MIGVLAIVLTLLIDQLSKSIVLKRLAAGRSVRAGPLLQIRLAKNRGRVKSRSLYVGYAILLTLIIILVTYVSYVAHLFEGDLAQAGLGAAIGGAVSNMFDRFWRLRVIDFIDLGFWPVFNFADVAIVAGVAITIWTAL